MRRILSVLLFFATSLVYAEEIFPDKCVPLVVGGSLVKLPKIKATITMIHNLSATDLWITHPVSSPSASAGWSSRLEAGNWSALASKEAEAFTLSCIESTPGHEQQVPCSDVVAVCRWTTVVLPSSATGTFWAGENMSLTALMAYIQRRGFEFDIKK